MAPCQTRVTGRWRMPTSFVRMSGIAYIAREGRKSLPSAFDEPGWRRASDGLPDIERRAEWTDAAPTAETTMVVLLARKPGAGQRRPEIRARMIDARPAVGWARGPIKPVRPILLPSDRRRRAPRPSAEEPARAAEASLPARRHCSRARCAPTVPAAHKARALGDGTPYRGSWISIGRRGAPGVPEPGAPS
jgi:hypothetical protein